MKRALSWLSAPAVQGFLHVVAIAALAIAAPLFENIHEHQQFLLAHHAETADLISFTLLVGIGVPALLALLAMPTKWIGPRTHLAVHTVFVGWLSAVFCLPPLNRVEAVPGSLALALAFGLGAATAVLYWKFATVRRYMTWLAPVALVFPAAFLLRSEILFPEVHDPQGASLEGVTGRPTHPVFVLLFDEFSTQSLLAPDKTLDAKNFPHFAALVKDATWFRNSTTVAETTRTALPPLLTGRYSKSHSGLPTARSHPTNLFTILNKAGYQVIAAEHSSRMCPRSIKTEVYAQPSFWNRIGGLLGDSSVILGHLLLKDEWAEVLPSMSGRWAGFIVPLEEAKRLNAKDDFDTFLEMVSEDERRLYYNHLLVPHLPYRYLPSGKYYTSSWDLPGWSRDWTRWVWSAEDGHAERAERRYLLQVEYVDTLIGRFVERLKALGIYDKSLIVITSDHGVCYRTGHGRRRAVWWGEKPLGPSAYDILKIPCFFKLPHQTQGAIVDEPFQSIDILPSILAGLGIETNQTLDGRNMFADHVPPLHDYRVYAIRDGKFAKHRIDILSDENDLSYKSDRFDSSNDFSIRNPEYDALIDRSVSACTRAQPAPCSVELLNAEDYRNVDLAGDYLPAQIRGVITPIGDAEPPARVAIAVNGLIRAVARSYLSDNGFPTVSAIVPEAAFRNGPNQIEIYAIEGDGGRPQLRLMDMGRRWTDLYLAQNRSGIHHWDGLVSYRFTAGRVEGKVTSVKPIGDDRLLVLGWAADLERYKPSTAVVLFFKHRAITGSRVHHLTRSLKNEHKKQSLLNSGFEFVLPREMLEGIDSLQDVRLYAVLDDTHRMRRINQQKLLDALREWFPDAPSKLDHAARRRVLEPQFESMERTLLTFEDLDQGSALELNNQLTFGEPPKDEDGAIMLVAEGEDPYLFLPKIAAGRTDTLMLKLVLSVPAESRVDLYWVTTQGKQYADGRRQRTSLEKGRNEVYFQIREPDLQGRLRIDPMQRVGEIRIHDLEVRAKAWAR